MKIGQKVRRVPLSLTQTADSGKQEHRPMTGTVVYIHPQGRYHMVAFEMRGGIVQECFGGTDD